MNMINYDSWLSAKMLAGLLENRGKRLNGLADTILSMDSLASDFDRRYAQATAQEFNSVVWDLLPSKENDSNYGPTLGDWLLELISSVAEMTDVASWWTIQEKAR